MFTHFDGVPEQPYNFYTLHVESQPSPEPVFPSSHSSPPRIMPSPQTVVHGAPGVGHE